MAIFNTVRCPKCGQDHGEIKSGPIEFTVVCDCNRVAPTGPFPRKTAEQCEEIQRNARKVYSNHVQITKAAKNVVLGKPPDPPLPPERIAQIRKRMTEIAGNDAGMLSLLTEEQIAEAERRAEQFNRLRDSFHEHGYGLAHDEHSRLRIFDPVQPGFLTEEQYDGLPQEVQERVPDIRAYLEDQYRPLRTTTAVR